MRGWKDSASVMSAKRCRLKMSTWQRCLEKFTADAAKVVGEPGTGRTLQKKWSQLMIERAIVLEGKSLRLRFEKKIERIVDRHLGDEVHLDLKFAGGFLEDQPGEVIGLGILLPVDEMVFRADAQGVTEDARARMRRGSQPNDLRPERHQPVVLVMGAMMKGDVNRHSKANVYAACSAASSSK
jgi:hypothetical protein